MVWLTSSGPAGAQTGGDIAGDPAAGEQVYTATCAMCHGPDATGMRDVPSLHGVVDRLGTGGVETTIRDGRQTNPPMPAFDGRLDDGEIDDVVAYLADLDEPPGQRPPDDERTGPRQPRQGMSQHMRNGPMMDGWWWAPAGLWLIFALLALAAVVAIVVVVLVRAGANRPSSPPPRPGETPRDILDARYARGDIDRDAYLQARRDLDDPAD